MQAEAMMEFLTGAILVGSGATALTDLWPLARRRCLGIALPDFALVGRWLAHMRRGWFRHASIAAAPRVTGEIQLGWVAHYLIGIGFAAAFLSVVGLDWIRQPRLTPALVFGIATVAAPLLLMQPAMGVPFAARRAVHSLLTHMVFGVGLYVAGWSVHTLFIH